MALPPLPAEALVEFARAKLGHHDTPDAVLAALAEGEGRAAKAARSASGKKKGTRNPSRAGSVAGTGTAAVSTGAIGADERAELDEKRASARAKHNDGTQWLWLSLAIEELRATPPPQRQHRVLTLGEGLPKMLAQVLERIERSQVGADRSTAGWTAVHCHVSRLQRPSH